MPRKERIKTKKIKELSDAAKGSIPLTCWLKKENKNAGTVKLNLYYNRKKKFTLEDNNKCLLKE